MPSQSPKRFERANALGARTRYDLPGLGATLGRVTVRPLAGRLESRHAVTGGAGVFFSQLAELPAWFWWTYGAVLVLAIAVGAAIGERFALRALYRAQMPTMAVVRGRVWRLRMWLSALRVTGKPAEAATDPFSIEAAQDDVHTIERELRELQMAYRPRRSENPALPPVRPLGMPDETTRKGA